MMIEKFTGCCYRKIYAEGLTCIVSPAGGATHLHFRYRRRKRLLGAGNYINDNLRLRLLYKVANCMYF